MEPWFIYLLSFFGPFGLLPILKGISYGFVFEEAFKGILTSQLLKQAGGVSAFKSLGVGLAYGFSESVLYSLDYWPAGLWWPAVGRLFLTVPMHGLTTVLWYWGLKRKMPWLGGMAAVLVHAGFNLGVGGLKIG